MPQLEDGVPEHWMIAIRDASSAIFGLLGRPKI
jgi:hypothetical protein